MEMGGFSLGKWKSNFPEIRSEEEKGNMEDVTKVLGVSWQPDKDAFTFIFDDERFQQPARTPRHLVAISHLYNSLGFLAPFQLLGRQMLQRSMTSNTGWDSPLEEDLRKEFQTWADSIPKLAEYTIAR